MKYIIIIPIGILTLYLFYDFLITESYHVQFGKDYELSFSISPDETFLDGQDDYKFTFYKRGEPSISLIIDDCLSRCWVLSQVENNPKIIILHGCHRNKRIIYEIDFNIHKTKMISQISKSLIIDTLTNLYVDKELPINYKYE